MNTPQRPPPDLMSPSILCDHADRITDLADCLDLAVLLAQVAWRESLEPLCHALARAETLIKEQPLPAAEGLSLVGHMRRLHALLRQAGPIIDTWDESQVCRDASARPRGRKEPYRNSGKVSQGGSPRAGAQSCIDTTRLEMFGVHPARGGTNTTSDRNS